MSNVYPLDQQDPSEGWDPAQWVVREQMQAQTRAIQDLDSDPDQAARAVSLSRDTGVPAPIIHGDQDNFELQHKAAITAKLLRDNQFLSDYARGDPMATKVSADDWGNLDQLSQSLQKLGIVSHDEINIAKGAIEGFKEGWGQDEIEPAVHRLLGKGSVVDTALSIFQTNPAYYAPRVLSGLMYGGAGALEQLYITLGGNPEQARKFVQDTLITSQVALPELGGLTLSPELQAVAQAARRSAQTVEPYLRAKKPPPPGVDPLVDQGLAEEAKQGIKALDEVMKDAHSTSTLERDPDSIANFIRLHTRANIEFDGATIAKLYGEKPPAPDDGILGWLPDITTQLGEAQKYGTDITAPLADVVARMEPEVYDTLRERIRVRPGARTLEEANAVKPAPTEGIEAVAPTLLDTVRRSAGLEGIGQIRPGNLEAEAAGRRIADWIPPDAQPVTEELRTDVGAFHPTHTFPVESILKGVEPDHLTNGPRALYEFFGNRIMKLAGDTPVYVIPSKEITDTFGANSAGFYHPGEHAIFLPEELLTGQADQKRVFHVVMEEASHAATWRGIRENKDIHNAIELTRLHTKAWLSENSPELRRLFNYALSDPYEMVAWSQSHPDFQRVLQQVPVSDTIKRRLGLDLPVKSVWEAVRQIVRNLMEKLTGQKPNDTVMDAMFRAGQIVEERTKATGGARGVDYIRFGDFPKTEGQPEEGPFRDASAIGMSAKRYKAYMEGFEQRRQEDAKFQEAQARKDDTLRQSKEWKENYDRVRDQTEADVKNRPDIAADRLIRLGELFGEKAKKVRIYGEDLTPEQKAGLPEEYFGKTGVMPDTLANVFGYKTANQFLGALRRVEAERQMEGLTPNAHFSRLVDAETDRAMRQEFGKPDEGLIQEAKEQALSPGQMSMLSERMMGLAEATGAQLPITEQRVRAGVRAAFDKFTTKNVNSDKDFAEMGRIETKVQDALLAGDKPTAFKLAQDHWAVALRAKEALAYEKEREASDRLIKNRLIKRDIPSVSPLWANFVHQLAIRGGVKVRRTAEDLAEQIDRHSWKDFLSFGQHMDQRGYPMEFSDKVWDTSWVKDQDAMTVEEWRGWSGALRTLYNYGQDWESVFRSGAKQDLEKWLDKAVPKLAEQGTYVPKYNKTLFQKLPEMAQQIFHMLVWQESVFHRWDGYDKRGIFKQTLSYDASEKVNQYSAWVKDLSADLEKEFKGVSWKYMRQPVESIFTRPSFRTPETPGGVPIDMNKENVLAVIKWMGTKSSEEKLIKGWMTGEKSTKEEVAAGRQKLMAWLEKVSTKEDWDLVERGVWGVNEKIYQKYARMVTELGGVPAQRVELNPITIHGKNYEGGYAHIIYDPVEGQRSAKLMGLTWDPETDMLGDPGFFRASTPKSHEKARTGYAAPLYLNLDRDPGAMSNILRDAAVRPFVVNASKIIYNNRFQDAVLRHGGIVQRDMLDPWVRNVAGMGYRPSSKAGAVLDQTLEYFSRNTVARLIGFNVNTIAKHGLSAAVNSAVEVGLRNISREWYHLDDIGDLHPDMSNRDFAMSMSHELRRRIQNAVETFGGQFEKLRVGRQWRDVVGEKGAAPIAYFDLMSATPTWIAAYKDEIVRMAQEGEVNPGKAVQIADYAVRRAHGSTSPATRPAAMQAGALGRAFTRLYGFFNTMLQRNYEAMGRTKYAQEQIMEKGNYEEGLKQIPQITKMLIAGNLAPALIEELITPYPSDENDSWGVWTAKMLGLAASGMIPGVREAVHAWVGGFGTTLGILDTGLKEVGTVISDLKHPEKLFDAEHGGKTIKDFNSLLGDLRGVTNDTIGRFLKAMWDVTHESKETPKNIVEFGRDVIKGHPRATEHHPR